MATRFVYKPIVSKPYVECVPVDFQWESGMSLSQREKSARNLHFEVKQQGLAQMVLECSRASGGGLGLELSAFNLPYFADTSIKVENVYQGSKVFLAEGNTQPYWLKHLYRVPSMEAKKCPTLTDKRYEFLGFKLFETGVEFPKSPKYIFYNYIYIRSLVAYLTREKLDILCKYDGFTDTMLRWHKGKVTSCQAHAIAMCIGMVRSETYDYHMNGSFEQYMEIYE